MKKLISIFLFFCLFAPFFGTYIWLKKEKRMVKKSIKWRMIDGMDKSELVLLKFTKEEEKTKLRWEHSREFEYNEQMYDIVEKKEMGDTTFYWCWWDYEETKLNRQLSELVANALNQNPRNAEMQGKLLVFFKNLFCNQLFSNSLPYRDSRCVIFNGQTFQTIFIPYSPPSPPPKLA